MSDRRNRKSNQAKDMKRPIILAKKEDKTHHPETSSGAYDTGSKSILDKPKILLKSKDKDHGIAAQQQLAPVQISIATRPTDTSGDAQKTSSQVPKNNSDSTHTKDPHHSVLLSSTDHLLHANSTIPVMKKSQPIITDHYQINSQTLDYLVETNTDFFVVGIIGALGSGKSTIMNILCESDGDVADENADQEELPWYSRNEIFKTRSNEYIFSNMVATEGIQMFIKRDRTILLDCSPVLCNPYKRDSILNEIDDLKMVIFLLNVCHLLIVVEEGGFNVNLLRLLQCAEKMKVDLYEKDYANSNSPNILFFKNYCENRDFLPESKELTNVLHKEFFKDSKLKIMAFPTQYGGNVKNLQQKGNVNIFYFPHIDGKNKNAYTAYPDINILIAELKQRVFMTSRPSFSNGQQPQANAFTEKNWSHLVLAVWESHKNNYFLRKYETFKEKEWATRNPPC